MVGAATAISSTMNYYPGDKTKQHGDITHIGDKTKYYVTRTTRDRVTK
jgi:hypothetical protein